MARFANNDENGNEIVQSQGNAPAMMGMGGMGAFGAMSPRAVNEMATVYSQMAIAQSFPRNMVQVYSKIDMACSNAKLALASSYAYAKGGTEIKGPSIKLARAIASVYGNFKYGFEVVSSDDKESKIRAFAFDMESNTMAERLFSVPHRRDTKQGSYKLTDAREIYELEANYAARRVRACILEVIPADVLEHAVEQCDRTLLTKVNVTPERIQNMVKAFADFGVSKKVLEAFVQRTIDSIQPIQFARLTSIYSSLKDGMGKPEDFFDMTADDSPKTTSSAEKTAKNPEKTDSHESHTNDAGMPAESEKQKDKADSPEGDKEIEEELAGFEF